MRLPLQLRTNSVHQRPRPRLSRARKKRKHQPLRGLAQSGVFLSEQIALARTWSLHVDDHVGLFGKCVRFGDAAGGLVDEPFRVGVVVVLC